MTILHLQGHQYQIIQVVEKAVYVLFKSIRNTESLTKSIQTTESDWQ